MNKEEYEDFRLRYKGCGACFPMYHTLSKFEKIWFSAIQKDIAKLEKENAELKKQVEQKQHLADVRVEQSLENYKRFSDEQKKRIDTEIALEDKIDQLTKAIELLKQFLKAKNSEDTYKAEWEAEQFLKDREVEK